MKPSPRINIIGAGPGGLAAALLLRHRGAEVRLLERAARVGGRCGSIDAQGFRFDVGPTFFLYPRVLNEIFETVGRDLFEEVPMTRLDPQYRLTFGQGGQLDATPDLARMTEEIARFSPRDAKSFERFMRDNRKKLASFRPILENPFSSVIDLLRPSAMKATPWLKPWHSVNSDLCNYFSDPRLVLAFSFQSKYLGMSPFRCPSLFTILAFLEYEYGVFHPIGGCGALSQRMADIAEEMGVELHLNEPVTKIDFEGKRAVAVRTPKDRYEHNGLVINSDFARSMTKLVPDELRRKWTNRKISRKRFSCSTFMMYLGVEGTFPDLPHHNIHICADYQKNLREIEELHVLSDDPSFYVQNATITDPGQAPAGMSTLYILVPVTHQHPNVVWNEETTQRFRRLVLDRIQTIGLPDLTHRIRYEKIITPDDWDEQFEVHQGATFNLAHSFDQMLHKRPNNRFEDLKGVYLVGGGTHPGSGLPVIYESSRITSRLLMQDLKFGHTQASLARLEPARTAQPILAGPDAQLASGGM